MSSNSGAVKHFGKIVDGIKKYYRPTLYQEQLKALEGKEFVEIIQEKHQHITDDQRGYYRATNRWLIDNTEAFGGWEEDELHQEFCNLFASYKKWIGGEVTGVEKTFVESTSNMGKKRMAKFIDDRNKWLSMQYSIEVPSPEEYYTGKYSSKS